MRTARLLLLLVAFSLAGARPASGGELNLDMFSFGGDADQTGFANGFPGLDAPLSNTLLKAAITPESGEIAPGVPFRIVLELEHLAGSYSYWTNPGGPGMGTTVAWKLPPGFTVSSPEWPAPQKYDNAGIISYIHKGKIKAVFTVTPPADLTPGDEVELAGDIATQVCTPRSCNPTNLTVAARVTAAEKPGLARPMIRDVLADLPRDPSGWRFEAADYGEEVVIAMYPAPGSNPEPRDIYFYDNTRPQPLIDSQKPQILEKENGVWWLRLPRLSGSGQAAGKLTGVVQAANGWLEGNAEAREFTLSLPVLAEGSGRPPGLQRGVSQSSLALLVFAFLGGLLLNVMPCVFPVIGLKIMGFARQAHKERRAVFLHGLAYTAGVLLCFWTLSFLVITMGRGWGAQLQSDWFMFALCHVFLIMSMNMAGVFDVGANVAGAGQSLNGREGLKRSFFTGLLATITSTPCSAPFLGTALAYALSLPPVLSLGVFTLMGLGFSFPYLALSLFPNWLKRLPKPGPWMDTFRQFMCFPLFATTAYLFWTIEAMFDEWRYLMLLFGLVMTAMACWLYGKHQRSRLQHAGAGKALFACAALSLAAGLWLGMPKLADSLQWMEWSPEVVTRLREEGRPVYVDFTARWCATCQLNKRVYEDPELVGLIQEKNVALLKADWTQYDDRITSILRNEFNKAAVPVTVLYAPGESLASVLPDILTVDNVREALDPLPDWGATAQKTQ